MNLPSALVFPHTFVPWFRAVAPYVPAYKGQTFGIGLAGALLGTAEQYAGFVLGAEFQTAFLFSLLVVVLVFRNERLKRQRRQLA